MSNGEEINEATLLAYLNKELSNEEMLKVDLWLTRSAANMQKFNDIRETWRMMGSLKAKPVVVDTDKAWNKVLGQINTEEQTTVIPLKTQPNRARFFAAIAAGIALLIGGMATFVFIGGEGGGNLEIMAQNEVVKDELPDGSKIALNTNSVLSYPTEFEGDERRVTLSGEAFFDIQRNEEKPFIIDLHHDFYVKVLGTSFNIKANDSEDLTEVFVNSGTVEFGSEVDKIILVAGEKGIMDNATGRAEKIENEVHAAKEMYWIDQHLEFEKEPLEEVIEVLNTVFNDRVYLQCDQARNEPIRSHHDHQTIDEILNVIASTHGLKIEKELSESGTEYYLKCND